MEIRSKIQIIVIEHCCSIEQRGPKSQAAGLLWVSKLRDCKRDSASEGDLKESCSHWASEDIWLGMLE